MSKKRGERQEGRLADLEELLLPDPTHIEDQEVEKLLTASDVDSDAFEGRLASLAREISKNERLEGRSSPPYLQDVVNQLDPSSRLPRGLKAAKTKAASWVEKLTGRLAPPLAPVVLEAYRKDDEEISEKDRRLLDDEYAELLKRVKRDDET